MIIGKGLIANSCSIIDNSDVLFFASGVSDSMNSNENDFEREIILLEKHIHTEKKFIYFSSIDEYIINKRYLEHKKRIENLIQNNMKDYIVLKIPQLIGKNGNPNNFINFIFNSIKNNLEFDMFLTKRSLLDVCDLVKILKELLLINYIGFININYIELMDTSGFIYIIENILGKKANIKNIIHIEQSINNNSNFVDLLLKTVIENTESYNSKAIKKYFIEPI